MLEITGNNIKFAGIDSNSGIQKVSKKQNYEGTSVSTQQPDAFVKQNEKENKTKTKLSTNAKIGIGAGIITVAGIVAAAILTKGKTLKPANFAEHIEFKPAQNMEDAIAYAKKNFGVEKFDFGDDVEMANWVNEGLTNINNRFKGKANMPKELRWADEKSIDKLVSKGQGGIVGAYCGRNEIAFNKEYFSNKLISDVRKCLEALFPAGKQEGTLENIMIHGEDCDIKNKLLKQYLKLLNAPEKFSRFDAMHSQLLMDDYVAAIKLSGKNPTYFIEKASKNAQIKSILESKGIDLSVEKFKKLSPEKQEEFMENFFNVSYENNIVYGGQATHRGNSKFDILYHEMGHFLHHMNTSIKDTMWGRLSDKAEKSFLADNTKLETAGKISWYAQTNPNEFVAETFNALCAGAKLPDDVMKMYREYKGPVLPNM